MIIFTEELTTKRNMSDYIDFVDNVLVYPEINLQSWGTKKADYLGTDFENPMPIGTSYSFLAGHDFGRYEKELLTRFIENERKEVGYIATRTEILDYFRPYFILNNKINLNYFESIEPKTTEFANITYSIYRVLRKLYPKQYAKEGIFEVKDLVKSPLVYKLSVDLDPEVTLKSLTNNKKEFEDAVRNYQLNHYDYEVHLKLEKRNGHYVFTLLRFDSNERISLGDIMDFGTGSTYTELATTEKRLPCIVGLIDNEIPTLIDLFGSGPVVMGGVYDEAWLLYSMITSLAMTAHYDKVSFVVCRCTDTPIWNVLSHIPHVLGYHTKLKDFYNVIYDVYNEMSYRYKVAKETGSTTFAELAEHLPTQRQLFLVLDGLTTIISYYSYYSNGKDNIYSQLIYMLNSIAEHAKLTGVSMLVAGTRTDKERLPENILRYSSMTIGMSSGSENDYLHMFGVPTLEIGNSVGPDNNLITFGNKQIDFIRTPVPGGLTDKQVVDFMRIISLEWGRKAQYNHRSLAEMPKDIRFEYAYNRDMLQVDVKDKLTQGKILPEW